MKSRIVTETYRDSNLKSIEELDINSLNYVELQNLKKRYEMELEELKDADKTLESIKKNIKTLSDDIMVLGEKNDVDVSDEEKALTDDTTYDKLKEDYNKYKEKCQSTLDEINKNLSEKYTQEQRESSLFMQNETVAALAHSLQEMENDPNKTMECKRIKDTISAFENRGDYSFFIEKAKLSHVIKELASDYYNKPSNVIDYIYKTFCSSFKGSEFQTFKTQLLLLTMNPDLINIIIYHMAKIYNKSIARGTDGNFMRIRLLIIDQMEITMGNEECINKEEIAKQWENIFSYYIPYLRKKQIEKIPTSNPVASKSPRIYKDPAKN